MGAARKMICARRRDLVLYGILALIALAVLTRATPRKEKYVAPWKNSVNDRYTWHRNHDIGKGHNISSLKSDATVAKCAQACDELGDKCAGFVIDKKKGKDRTCWFKNADMVTSKTSTYNPKFSSFIKKGYYPASGGCHAGGHWHVIAYEHANFQGRSQRIDCGETKEIEKGMKVSSIQINGKVKFKMFGKAKETETIPGYEFQKTTSKDMVSGWQFKSQETLGEGWDTSGVRQVTKIQVEAGSLF
jgi:hypothetical protein